MAGSGELLRVCNVGRRRLEIPRLVREGHPKLPVRRTYFATHFNNFYHVASVKG